jgi:predicted Fe-Mo cluster-binding NifX family protein
MKVCVCAAGPDLNSQVSPVFGRCPYFLIVDTKTEEFKAIPNPALQAGRGAGVAASQLAASEGAKAVICGNFGPNAFSVLQMSEIKIYPGIFGLTAKQAIDKYNKGELKEMKVPPVPGQFGLGPSGKGRRAGPGPRRRRGR